MPTAARRRDEAVSLDFSSPSPGGDRSSGNILTEGATEGLFSEGDSEGVAEGVAEGVGKDGDQEENGDAIVWNRLKLALGDVSVGKVVEKGALGMTAKGAMAVSCREVRQCLGAVLVSRLWRLQLRHSLSSPVRIQRPERGRCVRWSLPDTC